MYTTEPFNFLTKKLFVFAISKIVSRCSYTRDKYSIEMAVYFLAIFSGRECLQFELALCVCLLQKYWWSKRKRETSKRKDVCDSHEDNFNELESEFSSDNESLVSESLNSYNSDFADTETNLETDEDQNFQNNKTSLATSDGTTNDHLDPVQNNSERRSYHNIFREAPGPSTQAKRSIFNESVRRAWDLFIDESMLRHIQRCTEEEARRVLQKDDWCVS